MKIAIVGPSHPYKGGIVQETTELAHRLMATGHDVELVAWRSQYPSKLYPGTMLPEGQPELPLFINTSRKLTWNNPLSWSRAGKHLQNFDLVIFVWWLPTLQAPIYNVMLRRLKNIRTAVICHNVLPHEGRPGDKQLAQSFFKKLDLLIVHTLEQADLARSLTETSVITAELPPLLPGWTAEVGHHAPGVRHRLLFFGIVRDYKGLDVLLDALTLVPAVCLTVAGEFWGGTAKYLSQIEHLGLSDRVEVRAGYMAPEAIGSLFADVDALVLPYRSATGTTNVRLGFGYQIPVIVSDVPALAEQIIEGIDGLIFENGDAKSLAQAINNLYQPAAFKQLHSQLPKVAVDSVWQKYIEKLLGSV